MNKYAEYLKATTFAVIVGTGGHAVALPVFASNNVTKAFSPPIVDEYDHVVQRLSEKINHLQQDYKLGVDQLAKIFRVSRPTVYSWLNGNIGHIRGGNSERIEAISSWLDTCVRIDLRENLGPLLRRSLDPKVHEITEELAAEKLDLECLTNLQSTLVYKLEGIEQSSALNDALANKKPLI